jgi:hypothetical protein
VGRDKLPANVTGASTFRARAIVEDPFIGHVARDGCALWASTPSLSPKLPRKSRIPLPFPRLGESLSEVDSLSAQEGRVLIHTKGFDERGEEDASAGGRN